MTSPAPRAALEVRVLGDRDVPGAEEGGADRLLLAPALPGTPTGADPGLGGSPDTAAAAAVLRATALPVRVLLRLREDLTTTGAELTRLVGLAEEYVGLGAEGVCFGFLDADLEIDVEVCAELARRLPGVPWTFHAGFDATLDARRSWRRAARLPGLTAVHAGGSAQGLDRGFEELLAVLDSEPDVARLAAPGPGLRAEQVPWLLRAGVRQLHLGPQVRPGGSHRAYVDADFVRSWRTLTDAALAS